MVALIKNKLRPPHPDNLKDSQFGILAFETAKTMSRLISLYKSLSDPQISTLTNHLLTSKGLAFLNSSDHHFLLTLAWAERLEDLDSAAAAVARIAKRCNDFALSRFDVFYRDLKLGFLRFRKLHYGSKAADKKIRKMEKLVETTSSLHSALETLTEMEISERKLNQWKKTTTRPTETVQNESILLFYQKLQNQRRQVRHFREISLWSKSFDKIVDMMARIVCVVYSRISMVSGHGRKLSISEPVRENLVPHSGPIMPTSKRTIVRFYSRRVDEPRAVAAPATNKVFHSAGECTVGGSGLALRYANVILLAEEYLNSTAAISHDDRESLYQMLPENLKTVVGAKLSRNMRHAGAGADLSLAEGWRDAMVEMMTWLAPVARDTVAWQMERNVEKMKMGARTSESDNGNEKPSVLLVQTLHFADKEKTEAAIAEVLVGLSCIFRFENRRPI
ncbi:protein PSK SIMULATOR 1-like [Andrographis paniculata]|uniref:protein PSK SIMULATOR 1-like n=1 Tax=Andrographis paniculata TaxID=175694 RepID=UPI0021E71356|nr:protein PSK SIMULATOR 1-like [Andrographis paniculata]